MSRRQSPFYPLPSPRIHVIISSNSAEGASLARGRGTNMSHHLSRPGGHVDRNADWKLVAVLEASHALSSHLLTNDVDFGKPGILQPRPSPLKETALLCHRLTERKRNMSTRKERGTRQPHALCVLLFLDAQLVFERCKQLQITPNCKLRSTQKNRHILYFQAQTRARLPASKHRQLRVRGGAAKGTPATSPRYASKSSPP